MNGTKKKTKVTLQSGHSVSCEIYDDKKQLVGDFVFICANCGFEYFNLSEDTKLLSCAKCKAKIGYKLKGKFERPQESPGRKWLGFYTNMGAEYVWTCFCGHNLHHLVNSLMYTECEQCQNKTSRRKGIAAMAMTDKITWKI